MARANKTETQPEEQKTEEILTNGNPTSDVENPENPNNEIQNDDQNKVIGLDSDGQPFTKNDLENATITEIQTPSESEQTQDGVIEETEPPEEVAKAADEYLKRETEAAKEREEAERKALEAIPAVTNVVIK